MIDIDRLKKICGHLLRFNGIDPNTDRGREVIHIFWYAVMAQNQSDPPFVGMCLLGGRYEELVDMTGEPK